MKLQLAIDRVDIPRALEIAAAAAPYVDCIEIGTSLIKEYGNESIRRMRTALPDMVLLADSKTMDEGAYEFESAYAAGADIVSVMGAASFATIAACRSVAQRRGKAYLLDLLECTNARIAELAQFNDAIFCIHLSTDRTGHSVQELLQQQLQPLGGARCLAVAGGVNEQTLPTLVQAGISYAVVGSAITKAPDIAQAARQFRDRLRQLLAGAHANGNNS